MSDRPIDLRRYLQAERELRQEDGRRGFIFNAAAYVIVNAILITINAAVASGFPWSVFPLIGWGIGLIFHYLFGVKWASKEADEHETRVEVRARQVERRAA